MKHVDDVEEGRKGQWMQTSLGGRFYPLDPRLDEIFIPDIANGCALDCRYGGQGNVDRFYSVAEHCWLLSSYALQTTGDVYLAMALLLHDGAEAYVNDLPRAVKNAVGQGYKDVENNIQDLIFKKFGVGSSVKQHAVVMKDLDRRIVPLEKEFIFGNKAGAWAYDQFKPLEGVRILGLQPRIAKFFFIEQFAKLDAEMRIAGKKGIIIP
jgi:hypothetical protein